MIFITYLGERDIRLARRGGHLMNEWCRRRIIMCSIKTGVINMKYKCFIGILLVAILLNSCGQKVQPRTPLGTTISIVSLKEHLPDLEDAAKKWDDAPLLYRVSIPIFDSLENNNLWLISASFYSINKEYQSLDVELGVDGKINIHHVQLMTPIAAQRKPITTNDWRIDSKEAFVNLADTQVVQSLSSENYGFLFLECINTESTQYVVWRLSMSNSDEYRYLDASDGKILEISR